MFTLMAQPGASVSMLFLVAFTSFNFLANISSALYIPQDNVEVLERALEDLKLVDNVERPLFKTGEEVSEEVSRIELPERKMLKKLASSLTRGNSRKNEANEVLDWLLRMALDADVRSLNKVASSLNTIQKAWEEKNQRT